MTTTVATADSPEQLVARVQELQEALAQVPDSPTAQLADELVAAVVRLYGQGLERVIGGVRAQGGDELACSLATDPLVCMLLLIHDLHPVGLQTRVQTALDSVSPYMESHGGSVRLLSLDGDGVATIELRGSCSDCSASSVTLELAIKQALEEHAPDLAELVVQGARPPGVEPVTPAVDAAWYELDGAIARLGEGALATLVVAQRPLLVANVDGTLLAYEDRCAGCGSALGGGELSTGTLVCPDCRRSFHLPRAGRSLDSDGLALAPVPLLRDNGSVRVALSR
ncbi:MAG: NifU family protein [Solirubrobacteraceae bacterium]